LATFAVLTVFLVGAFIQVAYFIGGFIYGFRVAGLLVSTAYEVIKSIVLKAGSGISKLIYYFV